MVTDRTQLLVGILELKAIGIAGYMALAREWAARGDVSQVEIAYQMGAVEAQHLSLAHALVGVTPANDRAFARWLFADPAEAIDALKALDLLEGSGESIPFPGPLDRICRGVFGLTPETTADDDPAPTPGRAGQSGGDADSTRRKHLIAASSVEALCSRLGNGTMLSSVERTHG